MEHEALRSSLEAERRGLQASMEAEKRELRASMEAEWQKLRAVLESERRELRAALDTERRELLASLMSEWQDMRASQEAEWLKLRASQEMEWHELRVSQETERQRELAKTSGPLGPAHAVAESDIVRGVRTLNEEIFQATKRAADDCHFGVREADLAAVDEEVMGSRLAEILRSHPPREDDPTTLEIAIQAAIVSDAARIISSWSAQPTLDQGFRNIYACMIRSGRLLHLCVSVRG
ncbi:hypothetical protein DAEQUDRAFT_430280 [Daedalea quercina L-15889]|uniref:Uncharacterized protein n=1 Tax=Daedalea quercina L-15889 TaxID=1314783 RepID=A0A165NFI8_9APHY|nr:hypothetical protein DAEQUDRAFT_430280 [Daedalea quercina L-15889]